MSTADPLVTLRRYAAVAPWSGRELVRLADQILAAAGRSAARPLSERTLHYYVARGVVAAPSGRGAGSGWGYPHLIALLAARLDQAAGDDLEAIAARHRTSSAVQREGAVARALATALPAPEPLGPAAAPAPASSDTSGQWEQVALTEGLWLRVARDHPLLTDSRRLAALRDYLAREFTPVAREA